MVAHLLSLFFKRSISYARPDSIVLNIAYFCVIFLGLEEVPTTSRVLHNERQKNPTFFTE